MEVQQWWRLRLSFRNATMVVCFLNMITAIFLLHAFLTSAYTRNKSSNATSNSGYYIMESEAIRLALIPVELIKRVREIEQEAYTEPEAAQKKDTKQTAAVDLSKRLKDFRSLNDATSLKGVFLFSLHTYLNHDSLLCSNTQETQ
uniref:Uncharacterized protein n=1 Tax=Cajanus cajan TaxID=3821 RepID=A0A151U2Q8_CAJCA|nr:hypothetical protein KK1_006230 [Cajanus cajan]